MLKYLEPINCVQTVMMLVYKQINSDSFKNKNNNKLLT